MKKISKQLAVVVLFWNDSGKTIDCLKSLFKQQKQKFDIILVDNNSDQKYSKKILDWLKKKKLNLIKLNQAIFQDKKKILINNYFILEIKLIMVVGLVIIRGINFV